MSLGLMGAACGKKTDQAPAGAATAANGATTSPPDAAGAPGWEAGAVTSNTAQASAPAPSPGPTGPYLQVTVAHHDGAKPAVKARFTTFSVVLAHIDLSKPETTKAVLVVDLSSFTSGVADRDERIKDVDFLDVAKRPRATITVDRVKAAPAAETWDAMAVLELRGVRKEVPVWFKVIEKRVDGTLVVEGESKGLDRADWGMDKEPSEVDVGPTFDVQLRVELRETEPPPMVALNDLFGRMFVHQEAVIGLIEANMADAEAAAVAVESYTTLHKVELAAIEEAMGKFAPELVAVARAANQARLDALAARGNKLMGDNPELTKSERLGVAMAALAGSD